MTVSATYNAVRYSCAGCPTFPWATLMKALCRASPWLCLVLAGQPLVLINYWWLHSAYHLFVFTILYNFMFWNRQRLSFKICCCTSHFHMLNIDRHVYISQLIHFGYFKLFWFNITCWLLVFCHFIFRFILIPVMPGFFMVSPWTRDITSIPLWWLVFRSSQSPLADSSPGFLKNLVSSSCQFSQSMIFMTVNIIVWLVPLCAGISIFDIVLFTLQSLIPRRATLMWTEFVPQENEVYSMVLVRVLYTLEHLHSPILNSSSVSNWVHWFII